MFVCVKEEIALYVIINSDKIVSITGEREGWVVVMDNGDVHHVTDRDYKSGLQLLLDNVGLLEGGMVHYGN